MSLGGCAAATNANHHLKSDALETTTIGRAHGPSPPEQRLKSAEVRTSTSLGQEQCATEAGQVVSDLGPEPRLALRLGPLGGTVTVTPDSPNLNRKPYSEFHKVSWTADALIQPRASLPPPQARSVGFRTSRSLALRLHASGRDH